MIKLAILFAISTCVAGIHNGSNAKPGEIPYIVSIRNNGIHFCGGSILDKTRILTAAHCVYNLKNVRSLSIQYGVLNTNTTENVIPVISKQTNEEYRPDRNFVNDIAVLEIASPILFGENAQKVVLAGRDEDLPSGEWGVLAGWGLDRNGGNLQNDLKRVDVLVYTKKECLTDLGPSVNSKCEFCAEYTDDGSLNKKPSVLTGVNIKRDSRSLQNDANVLDFTEDECTTGLGSINSKCQFCSGVPEGNKGQCKGDNGGPLIVNGKQVGIVSWNVTPCAIKGYPGIFTQVSHHIIWINCILNRNC